MTPSPHTILIVEDEPLTRRAVEGMLRPFGYRVLVAESGQAALRIAVDEQPDLVLLDFQLGDMDGPAVCLELKQREQTAEIPVIFVSGTGDNLLQGYEVGGVDYIAKPIERSELLARLETHLRLDELVRDLRAARDELEERVEERTKELTVANQSLMNEVRQRKLVEEHLTFMARHDALTHLLNRQAFEERVFPHVLGAQAPGMTHSLLWLDLDNFRVVNEAAGPRSGDAFLRKIAEWIQQSVRPKDVTARVGGDEFAALLLDCPPERAARIAEDVRLGIEQLSEQKISASIGVATLTGGVSSVAELFSMADRACRIAKDRGGRRVMTYEAAGSGVHQMQDDVARLSQLQGALENDGFQLFQQRIAALTTEESAKHFEILLRLPDPVSGSPQRAAAFLPAAERFRLMTDIDRWVVRNALAQLERFGRGAGPRISINLSAQSVNEEAFQAFLEQELRARDIEPARVCFEITESDACMSLERTKAFIEHFQAHGCRFAIDDFGIGFSSYAYLKELPFDYLKIDGSFVRDMMIDETRAAMVRSINELGHLIGVKTVAEFVETDDQLALLREIGVDYAQGYAVHRPEVMGEVRASA